MVSATGGAGVGDESCGREAVVESETAASELVVESVDEEHDLP